MNGFTVGDGSRTGFVRREEMVASCSCGGSVHIYDTGEFIAHTEPFDKDSEHRVEAFGLLPVWEYVR